MDPFVKYNTPPPAFDTRTIVDNPLLPKETDLYSPDIMLPGFVDNPLMPKEGVPLSEDGFADSTGRIENAINTNDVRFDKNDIWNTDPGVWNTDPGKFYGADSGLGGIDTAPHSQRTFDLGQFNKVFERDKERAKESQRLKDLDKLNALSQTQERVSLYNLSLLQIIVNTKDAWFTLLDDLLDQRFELETLTKNNRIFYIGLTIIFFAAILYIYAMIMSDTDTATNTKVSHTDSTSVKKVYHIYQYPTYNNHPNQQTDLSNVSEFSATPTRPII